jgi:predicted nicotinamide N-methyase
VSQSRRSEVNAYGVRALLSRNSRIRKLKRKHSPTIHGTKQWSASWLLIDYIDRCGMGRESRVLDVGCGWGLAGIYCAKGQGATVMGVDSDPEVFPYLRLHARLNGVSIDTMRLDFDSLNHDVLADIDVVIGSDICFWDTMVEPLKGLIRRAVVAGVRAVIIADPGRPPFENAARYFTRNRMGRVFDWSARAPQSTAGRILRVEGDKRL